MRTTYGRISLGAALLAVIAIVVSCATLTRAPSEVAGARLFTFPGDWSTVPAKTITLFYPGQVSWGVPGQRCPSGGRGPRGGLRRLSRRTGKRPWATEAW